MGYEERRGQAWGSSRLLSHPTGHSEGFFFFQRMITKLKIQQRQWPLIPVQEQSDTPALLPRRLFGMQGHCQLLLHRFTPFLSSSTRGSASQMPLGFPSTSFPSRAAAPPSGISRRQGGFTVAPSGCQTRRGYFYFYPAPGWDINRARPFSVADREMSHRSEPGTKEMSPGGHPGGNNRAPLPPLSMGPPKTTESCPLLGNLGVL